MPRRQALSLAFLVLAATLAGCAAPSRPGVAYGNAYAPYDPQSNPNCGALGDCVPTNPIRLGPHDGAMGF